MDLGRLTAQELEELAKTTLSANKPLNFGPFILGALFDALLCGVFLMQCGAYIGSRNKDNRLIKTLVAFVTIMNIWGTVLTWMWIWDLFVSNFGTYHSFFSTTYLSWFFVINSGTVIAVQSFFGFRAWKLMNSNLVLAIVMGVLAIAACAGGIGSKVIFIHYDNVVYANKLKIPAYVCLSCTLAVDLLITGITLQYLMRKRTINKHTNHLMSQLAKVTFESQLPPTLIAIALFCVFTAKNDSFVNVPLIMMQCKLYGISLLHTLNIRESLTGPREGTDVTPEGCAITSGALQQFDLERLTFANPGITTVIDALPGHSRNGKAAFPHLPPSQVSETKEWQPETDDEGSRSVLNDDRMDDHDIRSKATLA
ncbi:hypothetical protein RSOLAG22IIIB_03638 [Rhizoctonia solani]|uniref:DUF6534 domain-containing protein n=1 Tax=Rhizoctonia solani TaxID=456999 RepID=A0A0K6FRF8_9AGAM|nr:hypothetical protein RSOLAG22IIIB_03638 [Rhizoctonia solani]